MRNSLPTQLFALFLKQIIVFIFYSAKRNTLVNSVFEIRLCKALGDLILIQVVSHFALAGQYVNRGG